MAITTIQVTDDIRDKLEEMKMYPRETYADVIERLIEDTEELSKRALKDVEEAEKHIEEGKFVTHDELRKELGL